mgnify:FL=1
MKNINIELSKYLAVDFLWTDLIEKFGLDKANKLVKQAIDLQKMQGSHDTIPIIFTGTGGLALIQEESFKYEKRDSKTKPTQVLIFNMKMKSFQILHEATYL